MKTLIENVRLNAGISQCEAELAVSTVLEYFAARLPSPVMGRICEALGGSAKVLETSAAVKVLGNG